LVGGEAGDRDRTGVRDIGQQSAERDDQLHADRLGKLDDQRREGTPAERRLVAGQQDQITRGAGDPGLVELDLGPLEDPGEAVRELDPGSGGLKVVELLWVDRREPAGA